MFTSVFEMLCLIPLKSNLSFSQPCTSYSLLHVLFSVYLEILSRFLNLLSLSTVGTAPNLLMIVDLRLVMFG